MAIADQALSQTTAQAIEIQKIANGVSIDHARNIRRVLNDTYTNDARVRNQIDEAINELSRNIRSTTRGIVQVCIEMELDFLRRAFTDRGQLRVGVGTPLRQEQIQAIAQMKYGGRTHAEWLNRLRVSTRAATRRALTLRNPNPTSNRVTQIYPELRRTVLGGRVGGQADAYIHSYLTNVESTARQLVRTRNRHLIKAEQYTAILDTRTSTICQHLHGRIVTYGDRRPLYPRLEPSTRRPPQHPACRSSMTPIFKSWRELGLRGLSPAARTNLNGQPPRAFRRFTDFLRSISDEQQLSILGPTRYDLWKRQGIQPEKFINRKGERLTIEQLRSKFL